MKRLLTLSFIVFAVLFAYQSGAYLLSRKNPGTCQVNRLKIDRKDFLALSRVVRASLGKESSLASMCTPTDSDAHCATALMLIGNATDLSGALTGALARIQTESLPFQIGLLDSKEIELECIARLRYRSFDWFSVPLAKIEPLLKEKNWTSPHQELQIWSFDPEVFSQMLALPDMPTAHKVNHLSLRQLTHGYEDVPYWASFLGHIFERGMIQQHIGKTVMVGNLKKTLNYLVAQVRHAEEPSNEKIEYCIAMRVPEIERDRKERYLRVFLKKLTLQSRIDGCV